MPAQTTDEKLSKLSLPELIELLLKVAEEIELRAMEIINEE